MQALPRGLCVPLPIALDHAGHFDPSSQERLLSFVAKAEPAALFCATGIEALPAALTRKMGEICHFAAGAAPQLVGVSASTVAELLDNLEYAVKLGAKAAVLDPLKVSAAGDPVALFHRQILPLFEKLGKNISILLEDSGGDRRLRTQDLKQLSRLEMIAGIFVSGSAKIAGNYLKGARHFKARHEFGVYLGNAELIFSLFKPARGAVGVLREQWTRLWLGAEPPQGIAPLSACLFPAAWSAAWSAALKGDVPRMEAFESAFRDLGAVDFPRVRAALLAEGIFSSDSPPPGGKKLDDAQRRTWLFEYFSTKKEFSELVKAGPFPEEKAKATEAPAVEAVERYDVVGIGGVVLDEFRRVAKIAGAESKVKVLGPIERLPGGVMLNQLSWLSALGASCALFGYTGLDAEGEWLRQQARLRGIDVKHLRSGRGATEVSRIFVDAMGNREIYLESGAVCATTMKDIAPFEGLIQKARLLSVEISLLPLEAVLEGIRLAHKHGKKVVLDLDIPASQAVGKAGLGSRAQLEAILKQADYLKSSLEFTRELAPSLPALYKKYKKQKGSWVVATDGRRGSQLYDGAKVIKMPAAKGAKSLDSTGCGDAYMAGLIAATLLELPLKQMGQLASASAAACVASLGAAAPTTGTRALIMKYYKGPRLNLGPESEVLPEASFGAGGDFLRVAASELQKFSSGFAPDAFEAAKKLIRAAEAQGKRLHVTGVGKPEYVAGYIASSFSSTGTPAFFLHATEAGHGASGQVSPGDVVVAISNSGETEELKSAVATVKKNGAKVIGVSGKPGSWLARQSDVTLFAGVAREGDALNLAPRASVLAEIMVLSALGVELQQEKKFSADDFRSFHPGGSLGKRS